MPGNQYLTTGELAVFALADTTDPALIRISSDLVDSFCQRESLLATEYTERNRLPEWRPVTRTTYTPLVVVAPATTPFVTVRARHGIGRVPNAMTLAEMITPFGGPPAWETLDPERVEYNAATGEIWLPAGIFGIPYTEVELTYTAGFTTAPQAVKQACAQIIRNIESHPVASVRTAQMDRLQLEYFAGSLLDEETRRLLAPFVAVKLQ